MRLFSVTITPVNASGNPLRNTNSTLAIARRAVELTGVIAATWTRGTVELLIGTTEDWHAESLADMAALVIRGDYDISLAGHLTLMHDLMQHVSVLTGLAMPTINATDAPNNGLLFNPWVKFTSEGLTAEGIHAALTVVSK